SMDKTGGIPSPMLPLGQALVNPHLMTGENFVVLPGMRKVMIMMDKLGNENYQPCFVPLDGGIPAPILGNRFEDEEVACVKCDNEQNIAYYYHDDRKIPEKESLRHDLNTGDLTSLGKSLYGNFVAGASPDHSTVILVDGYTAGDNVLYIWKKGMSERRLLYGIPLEQREGKQVPPSGIGQCNFTPDGRSIIFRSSIFADYGSPTLLRLDNPSRPVELTVKGLQHKGSGELGDVKHVKWDIFLLDYNIDGVSWIYETRYREDSAQPWLEVTRVLVGQGGLADGVVLGIDWQTRVQPRPQVEYVLSIAKANVPSQLYLYPYEEQEPKKLTGEKVLGIPDKYLSEGEDASYTSFDGLRISARLYLPSKELGFKGPRPLVEYVHGRPQGQERPDFTWFSMPLIQYLTLNGFAVFVPNVRGSTGYGLKYMKMVDRDWGGNDVKDHVHGLKNLEKDRRVDSSRRAVVGRSYGGYMTLTLASRHPELWRAAVDMFGPYDLPRWASRVPPSWMPYIKLAIGDPETEKAFLLERSPKTYFDHLKSPLMIIQGRHDPRVPEPESKEVVEDLKRRGLNVDYLVFEDEGHDVLRFKNRVMCYTRITEFFQKNLGS
ncbi:MAG TPA: prolyl oligopeptidase family serine peptidase, partial [Candidatus Binatus sp.]|nr:prolyl oligopeptidase family serine peptidase [Candidatus Binatus sp.]